MTRRFGFPLAAAAASIAILPLSSPLQAAELPPIKTSDANKVAECATPGRLMVYLKARNEKMDPRYEGLATEYMRHGEALSLRWDYAFFQMLLETGYLKYTGDVKADQNNFAGLGATGGGVRGESFPDISTGARAHLQHLQMYSGEKVENPVAQRTRDVQSWGVLASWQQTIGGPITFTHLAKKWAPGTKGYASDIQTIAQRFFDGPCKGEDPQPELVAEARGQTATVHTAASNAAEKPANMEIKGNDLARRAAETARADGSANRAGLGATALATAAPPEKAAATATPRATVARVAPTSEAAAAPAVTILNPAAAPADTTAKASNDAASAKAAPAKAETAAKAETTAKTAAPKTESPTNAPAAKEDAAVKAIETASVAGAKDAGKPEKKAAAKCRVWTASYGGAKAIIIKAVADQTTNYTVLDVNEGAEKREAEAYISAYAKGGESVGEFASQTQALDKAFELCPEG